MADLSTSQFIQQLLSGRSPFGNAGVDFANTLAQIGAGYTNGQIDPRLSPYFTTSTQGGENPVTQFNPTGAVNNQGMVTIDGKPWIQLAGATDNTTIRSRDPSMFKYDPQFGELTPASNLVSGSDPFSNIAPWAMLAMAGAGASGLLGGAGDAASGLGNVTQQVVGDIGGADSTGMGAMGGASVADPTGMGAMGGATAPSGYAGWGASEGFTPVAGASSAAGSGSPLVFAPGQATAGAIDSSLINAGYPGLTGASGLLGAAINNPIQALGLLQMGRGLLTKPTTASTSSGKPSGGGTGLPTAQNRPAWSPNPFTQSQIQQLYGPNAR